MEFKDLLKVGKVTNYALVNMRGRVDDLVFRRLKSGTYISRMPKKPTYRTEGQQRGTERFRRATEFAKAMLDPETKAHYKQIADKSYKPSLRNAYTAAIKDYLNRPETKIKAPQQKGTKAIKPAFKRGNGSVRKFASPDRGPLKRHLNCDTRGIRRPGRLQKARPSPRSP